ncbi:sensor histidine kinase [Ohtaekwangia koreensis]|uniref:histidine kinase n=1 Tax=Ohtaekwangia koreensis TaxID=688867 RepID=A0A1T5KGK9_9BACT|nr:ATP-binding protein [Ohtaekwangia koreensis]SKC62886.1 Histidine kinase-, DNA gyrase B-, and HSP90-like ATPase [Ohtaekwangia koreensis]
MEEKRLSSLFTQEIEVHRYSSNGEINTINELPRNNVVIQGELQNIKQQLINTREELRKGNIELSSIQHDVKRYQEHLEELIFISNHNLQEPLRKIVTFSNRLLMPDVNLTDAAKNYTGKINTSASRMLEQIKDLVHFFNVQKNTGTAVYIDLNDILKHVIVNCKAMIDQKKAVIRSNVLPTIYGSSMKMQHLFQNLLDNALKFSSAIPAITIISALATEDELTKYTGLRKDQQYFFIRIYDNGIGFDEKYLPKMFMLFQKVHLRDEGTGAGLSICRKIVEEHDGFIFARGIVNVGAVFTIFLPTYHLVVDPPA